MTKAKNKRLVSEFGVIKTSITYVFSEAWIYRASYFFVYIIDIFFRALQPFLNLIGSKFLIDELIAERDIGNIALYTICIVGGNLVFNLILACTKESIAQDYINDFQKYFDAKLGLKIMKMDFEKTENKEMLDQVEKAKNGMSFYSGGIGSITESLATICTSIITLVGTVGILLYYVPLLFIIIIITMLINSFLNKKVNKIKISYFDDFSKLNRAFSYILNRLSHFEFGKDIRLYAADKMMLSKADECNMSTAKLCEKQSNETLKYTQLSNAFLTLQDGFCYLFLGFLAIYKYITIGTFTMLITLSSNFGTAVNAIITQMQELLQKSYYVDEYVKFMNLPDTRCKGERSCIIDGEHTIEFRNVYFAYPKSEKYILENLSITIKSGEHLSIVGLNGAGKTTFVKLICRLYEVTKGEILLDGYNILEYNYEEYIKLISIVFQDFKLVAFSLKENIVIDDIVENKELDDILSKVGLTKMIELLPNGLQTPVFKYYDIDGVEPSGGEQQKLAIARALYKNAPIVILDEPTAALDPVSEYEIYNQFDQLIAGKTAIYISHRLSSCKFCDKIAVFANGNIIEYGTHDELIQIKGGAYSEMFYAQAQYYS